MMNQNRAFQILEIDSYEFNISTIKRQYRLKALKYHPDKNPAEDASEKFHEITEAYGFLMKILDNKKTTYEPKSYKEIFGNFFKRTLNLYDTTLCDNVYSVIMENKETIAEKILDKIELGKLTKIYDFLKKHGDVLNVPNELTEAIRNYIDNKPKPKTYVLNPNIHDLFENMVYKLQVNDETLLIPLWHHELVYEHNGNDINVKCIPSLPENTTIDEDNNIVVDVSFKIQDIWSKDYLLFYIDNMEFGISKCYLKLQEKQVLTLDSMGISKIDTKNIYDVNQKSNIIVNVTLSI